MLGEKLQNLVMEIDELVEDGKPMPAEAWNLFLLRANAIAALITAMEQSAEPSAAEKSKSDPGAHIAPGVVNMEFERQKRRIKSRGPK